jgi:hypothetical protein
VLVGGTDEGRRQRRWNMHMIMARRMIAMGHNDRGFRLIDRCLGHFPAILRSGHPYVVHRVLSTVFAEKGNQPDLQKILWQYFTDISAAVFGSRTFSKYPPLS